ncbi:LysR family transcriptional regulator [Kamptonema cortianum]|nr:LysR family transcriptional regulator [Kamptonema cortianum]
MIHPPLNYHHLKYFWAVAHEKSLTRAARHLNLSQSALSLQVKSLEDSLGMPLFDRSHKSLQLTEAGRIAYDYAGEILKNGAGLLAALAGGAHARQKTLTLGVVSTLSRNFVMQLIQPMLRREDIRLVIHSGDLRELLAHMQSHTMDIVLSNQPVHADAHPELSCRLISEQPVSLVAAPGFKLRKGRFPDCLQDIPMILPGSGSALRAAFEVVMEESGVRPLVVAESDDMAMMRLVTREARACALLPTVVVQDELKMRWLRELLRVPDMKETFYTITPQRRFANPIIHDLLREFGRNEAEKGRKKRG